MAEEPVGFIWADPPGEDRELFPLDDADWEADLAVWEAECDASRAIAAARALDDLGTRNGEPCSLRWPTSTRSRSTRATTGTPT